MSPKWGSHQSKIKSFFYKLDIFIIEGKIVIISPREKHENKL